MLDFIGKRMQKSIAKMKAKTTLKEEDIIEVTREIKLALLEADVNLMVVKNFVKTIKEKAIGSQIIGQLNASQQMLKIVKDGLTDVLGTKAKPIEINGNPMVIMMVGLQGSGKTTTTAKVSKFLMKKHGIKKPLMVAADVYRPAAIDQLITLGKQLQIDVHFNREAKPKEIVEAALKKAKAENHDLVLIDTAGRLSIDENLMEELVMLKKVSKPHEILFVADALSGQDIINVATTFNEKLDLTGSIITKLDSDARGGAALSLTKMLELPIRFIGTGEKVQNLDLFHPDRMADRLLGMGDVLSLIEQAGDVMDEDKTKRMMSRMASGRFNLNDLLDQMRQIQNMGKMSKILKMIPGMANKISGTQIESAEKKLKLFEILISSMTEGERKTPKLLKNNSRKQRVMKGSGRTAQEYNLLINEFEKMSKQMKEMSKSMADGTFNPSKLGLGM